MQKLNPEWTSHNNLHNEGGEGYNPHPKYITVANTAATAPLSAGKVYRNRQGRQIDPVALIAESEARLARVTDKLARAAIEKSIAEYRAMMEG
jgi:hypothetical protein